MTPTWRGGDTSVLRTHLEAHRLLHDLEPLHCLAYGVRSELDRTTVISGIAVPHDSLPELRSWGRSFPTCRYFTQIAAGLPVTLGMVRGQPVGGVTLEVVGTIAALDAMPLPRGKWQEVAPRTFGVGDETSASTS